MSLLDLSPERKDRYSDLNEALAVLGEGDEGDRRSAALAFRLRGDDTDLDRLVDALNYPRQPMSVKCDIVSAAAAIAGRSRDQALRDQTVTLLWGMISDMELAKTAAYALGESLP